MPVPESQQNRRQQQNAPSFCPGPVMFRAILNPWSKRANNQEGSRCISNSQTSINYIRIIAAAFGIHKKLLLYMTNKNKCYCCSIEEVDTDFSTWLQYQTFMYHIKIHDLMLSFKRIFFFKMAYILLSLLFFQQENM